VSVLRRAFDAAMKDSELVAEAQKLGSDVDPLTGEETEAAINSVLSTPKMVIAQVKDMLK
jgi:hypothetical protein